MTRLKQIGILFLVIFTQVSCGSIDNKKREFKKYLQSIPELKIPLTIRCDEEFIRVNNVVPTMLKEKFLPSGNPDIMGKIIFNDSAVGVVYLYPADSEMPVLKTYSLTGNPIDSLQMIDRYCGLEYESEGYSWIKLNKGQIELSDTTKFWKRDSQHEKVPDTDQIEMRKTKFKVVPNGKIVEIK